MSQFNAIGEYGLNDVLTKRLTTPGGSNAPSVAPEIFPTLALESDRPEWGYLKSEIRYGIHAVKAAVVAEYGAFQFYLPTTARTIAVIELVQAMNANNFTIARLVGISGGLGGWTATNTQSRDTRAAGLGGSVFAEINGNAARPTNFGRIALLQGLGLEYTQPIIIAPGGSIGIFSETTNQELRFNIAFRERPAQPGELA